MKPIVLHVAAFANPAGGGFVRAIARLARDDRFRTELLVPRESAAFPWTAQLAAAGVRLSYAAMPVDAAAAVARSGASVVHAHFAEWMLPATLGAKAAGARVAWHLHSGTAPRDRNRELGRRVKYAAAKRLVERFFCVSDDLVGYLERYGVPSDRVEELPNGVDVERFRPPTLRERAAARQHYHIAPRERVVAFFGRDARIKGADLLAKALVETTAPPPTVIAIAPSRATLDELSRARVVDAGSLSDVRDALWAADALALPSRSEGVPYSLLEARACGVPAVAAPLPGVVRALGEDAGTTLVDPHDSAAFAQALDRALQSQGAPLEERVARAISLDRWAESLASWYVSEAAA